MLNPLKDLKTYAIASILQLRTLDSIVRSHIEHEVT